MFVILKIAKLCTKDACIDFYPTFSVNHLIPYLLFQFFSYISHSMKMLIIGKKCLHFYLREIQIKKSPDSEIIWFIAWGSSTTAFSTCIKNLSYLDEIVIFYSICVRLPVNSIFPFKEYFHLCEMFQNLSS